MKPTQHSKGYHDTQSRHDAMAQVSAVAISPGFQRHCDKFIQIHVKITQKKHILSGDVKITMEHRPSIVSFLIKNDVHSDVSLPGGISHHKCGKTPFCTGKYTISMAIGWLWID